MAAPTPVSAYLHSATMVKAGVFLLARLYPALAGSELWFWLVSGTGALTLDYAACLLYTSSVGIETVVGHSKFAPSAYLFSASGATGGRLRTWIHPPGYRALLWFWVDGTGGRPVP